MITLEYVNDQVNLFNKFYRFSIPNFSEIADDLSSASGASISIQDLRNNKFILHYNKAVEIYSIQNLNGLLWHEFTHVYDYMFRYKDNADIHSIMNSISEANAKETEYRYLINLSGKNTYVKTTYIIPFVNEEIEIGRILKIYVRKSWEYLNSFMVSKKPEDFVWGIKNWFYFLGSTRVLINGEKHPPDYIDKFDPFYEEYLTKIFIAFKDNNLNEIIKSYNILEFEAKKYSGVR